MDASEAVCALCGLGLRSANLSGVAVRVCGQCRGMLLAETDLIRTLEALSVEMLAAFDPDTHLDPVPERRSALLCPACQRPMSSEDYCGAGLVHFDRCGSCRSIWLGTVELGTMTLMWARMEKRAARTQEQIREALAEADAFVTNVQLGDKLGVDRTTPGAFVDVLGDLNDCVGAFLVRLLHSSG